MFHFADKILLNGSAW